MTNLEMMMKLCLALLFGLLIGIDRQIKQKQLGIRPSMVICITSCLITMVSIEAFGKFAGPTHPNMDPMRLAAQIVSGVGFIGAGVILRRSNEVISGLTSAALIWSASGLGIAIGAGFYVEALCAVILLILSINLIPYVIRAMGPQTINRYDVAVKIVMEPNIKLTEFIKLIERTDQGDKYPAGPYKIRHMKLKDLEDGRQLLDITLSVPEKQYTTEIYYFIKKMDHVRTVAVEHL